MLTVQGNEDLTKEMACLMFPVLSSPGSLHCLNTGLALEWLAYCF